MSSNTITYPMYKRGFIDGVSLALFIIVFVSVSGATYILTTEDKVELSNYFVGNSNTKNVYPYSCVNIVPEGNRIFFQTRDIAESYNYTYKACKK